MPEYRRAYEQGGMFFFTVVTHRRRRLLSKAQAREYLRSSILSVQADLPFELIAIVLLPDHLHCIWKLPEGDADFPIRWACIKRGFSKLWIAGGGSESEVSDARREHRERGVWQRRFWEHRIRDEDDMVRHVNYIHYNPVKHGLVRCPHKWPYSSFQRWVEEGYYKQDWLCDCNGRAPAVLDFANISDTVGE
jgi:putative transposase